MTKIPNSRRNLDLALERLHGQGRKAQQARTSMANAIVGQLLPRGVVKGGSALRLRYGYANTRFTTDLDAARDEGLEIFIDELAASLESGWNGFTGTITEREPAHPTGVPEDYVMQPFDVKLAYNGKSWVTVPLEIGHDEIGDSISKDMVDLFTQLGFPAPRPVAIMSLHHQIAQKLHGLTGENSARAHDLIDLQLITAHDNIDMPKTKEACARQAASRRKQVWPPTIVKGRDWGEIYDHAKEDLPVLPTVDEAVVWGNRLVVTISEA
ncbi:nucleotidyl transferase AbiEii/AbiGii toxin family protein [Thermophilibacter immobilis]|uniref:Nucleotidyl transferase AbiEii/AbiGii toxin family protein n=1 Tax=Thermophilibacter immobilis TaxID=2779519 RepID=A0A7S7M940_9ACTN|nr:nucleotidyl transferase AbiEii/AbiGii toxin family protein [Thermophilibacter immobilis]QOY60898.1 nucleotidyl transferase AbiEii/AbiGii toxin family protein [Thermophilibacter immobilis]